MTDHGPVAAEITGGILPPTTYPLLPGALSALWFALQLRPLGRVQWERFERYLTGPGADRFVAEHLTGIGPLSLQVLLPDGMHHLRLGWTGADAPGADTPDTSGAAR
ncbi:hypothetical protein ACWC5I_10895 [Kitasatospora sp. NPDC001574]